VNNMRALTYRERFARTLAHQAVDRAPFDLGGTPMTGIAPEAMERLTQFLGFSGPDADERERFAEFGHLDERVLGYFDIDIRRVGCIVVPENDLARRVSDNAYIDEWGIKRVWTGTYWDIVDPPLRGASIDDLESYPWPDPLRIDLDSIERLQEEAKRLFNETPYVVSAEHPVYGVFELGCWMCGFDDFLMRMAIEPQFVHRFFEIILDYQKKVIDIYYGALGPYIHFTTSGDDFGTQASTMMSPEMFRELIKPYFAERIAYTKQYTSAAFFHHSCGSVYAIIPDLIDCGVEILNPIQPRARDMEPDRLKAEFGDQLTFYGGVDTQELLPRGDSEEIDREVRRLLDCMSSNGGYVFAAAHNLQGDVPPESIVAMFDSAKRYFEDRSEQTDCLSTSGDSTCSQAEH